MFLGWTNEMVACVVPSDLTALPNNSAPLLTRDGDRTVIWLDGELDIATVALLAETLATASSLDDADQIVDLSRVTFLDAMTIGVLIGHRNGLLRQSRSLMLRCPSNVAWRVLDLCGLTALLEPIDRP